MTKYTKHKNEFCYFCGSPASSTEHVPPKQMFRAFDCDSITVPSCVAHNSGKSEEDQSIVSAFLLSLVDGVKASKWLLEPDVEKALKIHTSAFQYVKNITFKAHLLTDPPKPMPKLAYSKSDLKQWIRQLTAAILYNGTQNFDPSIEWSKVTIWSPNWAIAADPKPFLTEEYLKNFEFAQSLKPLFENRNWKIGWSAHPRRYPPNIYRFYVDWQQDIYFKHVFYNRYTWYVTFTPSPTTNIKLKQKIGFI